MSSTSSSGSSTAGGTSTSASTASTTTGATATANTADASRAAALTAYRRKYIEHRSSENRLKTLRLENSQLSKDFKKTEDDLIAIQSVGQIIGEVLKSLDTTTPAEGGIGLTDTNSGSAPLSTDERVIVKASSGPRYVVGKRSKLTSGRATNTKKSTTMTTSTKGGGGGSAKNNNKNNPNVLVAGSRVSLDMTTLTIMRILPREVDPMVFGMIADSNSGNSISYNDIGGLSDEIRELREVIELPLTNPELFKRVGITPPKGVLLYGPPGTGKTLLARALASNIKASYLRVVASAIVDKYIGESARIIREMFEYARSHAPCVIFMDEIDAIGGRRFSAGTSADREIQRTLMELLNQIDGFDTLVNVKIVMATNRPDTLDPALTRPGRLDRKIEIPLPSLDNRTDILMIHATPLTKHGQVDYQHISRMCEGFNGADLRNVCTEAGMFAIRQERPYVQQEDFVKAARKIQETKKLEGKLEYEKI